MGPDAPPALGFPSATDIDWTPLAGLVNRRLLNNLGDPYTSGLYPLHTKDLEREAIGVLADLFRAPPSRRWGYIATGATEGALYGLWLARRYLQQPVVYHSTASHPGIRKAVDVLRLPALTLRTTTTGELDYTDLAVQVAARRHRPAIVVANIGTTWTESIDDVRLINRVLDEVRLPAQRRFVVADAALSGIPLATLDPAGRPGFDLSDGADVVITSGHKFLATPIPCAAVVVKDPDTARAGPMVSYTGATDTTIGSSRSGLAAVLVWYALTILGRPGLTARARTSRELAHYLRQQLTQMGCQPAHEPHAMTVTLTAPAESVRRRWGLSVHNGRSHVVCAPGVTRQVIDRFLTDLSSPPGETTRPHGRHPHAHPDSRPATATAGDRVR